MAQTAAALHVTNGDAVMYLLKKAGILGTHLSWRDALHEGPVPEGMPLDALTRLRGTYLASRGFGSPIKLLHELQQRDELILRARAFDAVVLWFEHDLYDQLQLLQILVVLGSLRLEPGRVSIVQTDAYLSNMSVDEIRALYAKRRIVTPAMHAGATNVWSAFTAPDPSGLAAFCRSDVLGFPHVRAAVRRLCEEYPWQTDGLSRTQRQALAAVEQGAATRDELFRRAQAQEEAPFLPERMFYATLEDLASGAAPLIEDEAGSVVATALGRRLLAGDGDWAEEAPMDRWIGGVHLEGKPAVRWSDAAQALAPATAAP
jgi:hypothetical protein